MSGRSRHRASGGGNPLPGSPPSFLSLPHPSHSFLIGEDGLVYEGRGWKIKGDHSGPTWNPRAIGITFMGNFMGEWLSRRSRQGAMAWQGHSTVWS